MPLHLAPLTTSDCLSWVRIRALAYAGPTNLLVHNGQFPLSESSILGVANERKKEIGRPNCFHFKIVDTDLPPAPDDPQDNGGRTIAVASWIACNIELDRDGRRIEGSNEPIATTTQSPPFVPPELNTTILAAILTPLQQGKEEIMGDRPYFMLITLSTHPEHQRRGAGSMLVKWGVDVADRLHVEAYLSTSIRGRLLYERFGFELVRGEEFDRTVWGGEGVDWHGHMMRRPR
ncbi:hypothetical protein K491DRAFT_560271, partial [Lophiostoma macrostomum CBS 122681]